MSKMIRASVAMAVYNGEKYLTEQLDSILNMLGTNDEIVISYDISTDKTLEIINSYLTKDNRIRCVKNKEGKGVSSNFNNAIFHCRGEYIFISDQDDVWVDGKIDKVIQCFNATNADLVVHNGILVDKKLNKCSDKTLFEICKSCTNPLLNFYKGRFLGCSMALRKRTLDYIMPFPKNTVDYDIFATIMVGLKGKIVMLDQILIYHRLHDENVTPVHRNKLYIVFFNRLALLKMLLKRLFFIN